MLTGEPPKQLSTEVHHEDSLSNLKCEENITCATLLDDEMQDGSHKYQDGIHMVTEIPGQDHTHYTDISQIQDGQVCDDFLFRHFLNPLY